LDQLSDTYVNFIGKLSSSKDEMEIDIKLPKRYKSNDLVFTGQEIFDNIQKKLADDTDYKYEFKIVDNKPIVKKMYRVSFDDQQRKIIGIEENEGEGVILTLEELKSKHVEAIMKITELKETLEKREADNFDMFKDIIDALGGLYNYVSKKKLVLMLSKTLKENNFYKSEIGTQYSYEELSSKNKDKIIFELFKKIYK
jgi:hypothetical protein